MASIEEALDKLGWWQVPVFSLYFVRGFPIAFHILFLYFGAPKLDHWCARPEAFSNWTVEEWKEKAIPSTEINGEIKYSKCSMYRINEDKNTFLNTTVDCKQWEYDHSFFSRTLVDEWDLVCDRSWLISLQQSLFLAGMMCGNIIFASVSDRYGRKRSILCSTLVLLIFGLLAAASPSFLVYNIIRFFISIGIGGYQSTFVSIATESITQKKRPLLFIGGIGWLFGLIALAWIAYAITDWIILQIVTSLSMLSCLALWFLIPESPRWLLAKHKFQEAEESLLKVCRQNNLKGIDVTKIIEKHKHTEDSSVTAKPYQPQYRDLVSKPRIRWITIMVCIMFFSNRLLSFHLTFFSAYMGDSPFMSFTLVNLISLPGELISIFIVRYFRRRIGMTISFLSCSVFILLLIPFNEDQLIPRVIMAGLAKNCLGLGGCLLSVFSSELFPTVVRTMGVGCGYSASRIGAMLSPFFKELAEHTSGTAAACVSATAGVLGALATFLCPETLKRVLPETIEEAEVLLSRKKAKNTVC